jgi:hypothetical protein
VDASVREIVDAWPHARRATRVESGSFASRTVACGVLTIAAGKRVLTSKGLLLVGGWVAVAFALVATSGLASAAATQILLASGAAIALMLTKGSRRD